MQYPYLIKSVISNGISPSTICHQETFNLCLSEFLFVPIVGQQAIYIYIYIYLLACVQLRFPTFGCI